MAPVPETYLIADDSPTVQLTLKKMLENQGVPEDKIQVAEDGETALELFREHEPDVVFMDIDMPGIGGEQAASTMMMERPMCKIVVVTGATRDDEQVKRLISLGAYEFLEKPIRHAEIRSLFSLMADEDGRAGRIR